MDSSEAMESPAWDHHHGVLTAYNSIAAMVSSARDPDHIGDNNDDDKSLRDVEGDHDFNSTQDEDDDYNSSCKEDVDYDFNSKHDENSSHDDDDDDGIHDSYTSYNDEDDVDHDDNSLHDDDDGTHDYNLSYDDYYGGEPDHEPKRFERAFRCYPVSMINKPHLEEGNKIIMPPSSLETLVSLWVEFPMMFELTNPLDEAAEPVDPDAEPRVSHCGVMEFTADEGTVYMPQWMMENLHLKEGRIVHIKNVTLQSCTHLKLQPHSKEFLRIGNPKEMLEIALRNFSCLTEGDTIVLPYNDKKYVFDILETKPDKAVSIIETDCEADFAAPLDYVEPPAKPVKKEEAKKEESKNVWFTGVARRVDGKPCSTSEAPNASSQELKSDESELKKGEASAFSGGSSSKPAGKLVFGSDLSQSGSLAPSVKAAAKDTNPEPVKKEEKKFQAFTGTGYSLR